ncbi:MAG: prolipoprotein diacylglyceryl transferase [Pirellulaceae bacterium]|nr:prolipoprotein diacylglyceryl transferase [Pirellulaceae bacterium]
MLQTLFHIPLWPFESPWIWVWTTVMMLGGLVHGTKKGWADAAGFWGPPLGLLWVFSIFLMGEVVDYGIDPNAPTQAVPLGIAVRGYGLMMLLGIVAGVVLAVHRGHSEGLTADHVFSLALYLVISGIVGARVFYVVQYWESFSAEPMPHRIIAMLNMTKGGLVVLGSFVGGLVGMLYWAKQHKIRFLKLADLVGPSFLIGLSLGRIGCFFNGCCFGGYCEIPQVGIQFPVGSAPYVRQLENAAILGVQTSVADQADSNSTSKSEESATKQSWRTVTAVPAGSVGERLGLEVGNKIRIELFGHPDSRISTDKVLKAGVSSVDLPPAVVVRRDGLDPITVPWSTLPPVTQPIHPTQLYSSVNAFILAILVGLSYRFRRFDGQSFAWLLVLYGITRFIIEWIRVDEPGQFGTDLSISQWGCIGLLIGGVILFVYGSVRGTKLPTGTMQMSPDGSR